MTPAGHDAARILSTTIVQYIFITITRCFSSLGRGRANSMQTGHNQGRFGGKTLIKSNVAAQRHVTTNENQFEMAVKRWTKAI
jgi:hypothetical protein